MKYIDAEKLITFLKKKQESYKSKMVDPSKYPIDHIDLMAFLASEYQALILQLNSLQQEQPKVDYNEFEKLFADFCERNKGHHITSHDACMWFWELGLNVRKEE